MIKKKLAIQIAQRIGNGREETTKLLDVLCEVLGDTLDAGVFVHLTGLGRLTVRESNKRIHQYGCQEIPSIQGKQKPERKVQ